MKRDKLFRFESGNTVLVDEPCTRGPGGDGCFEHISAGQFSLGAYLQQSRIDLEKAASSPWETLKAFCPDPSAHWCARRKSLYVSAPVPDADGGAGLLAGECTDGALLDLVGGSGCGVLLVGNLLEEAQKLCEQVESWRQLSVGVPSRLCRCPHDGREGAAGVRPAERC